MSKERKAEKIILDTDPGIDDAMAILFAMNCPDIELLAISTVFGNASLQNTTRNALFIKNKFDSTFDVVSGAEKPLKKTPNGPTDHVHGIGGLGIVEASDSHHLPISTPSWEYMADRVRADPNEITLVAIGPLTNLALLVEKSPEVVPLVKKVVIMGGAFGENGHRGNVSPVAEANIHDDPLAADIVFGAEWPVTIIGLDVTHEVLCTDRYLEKIRDSAGPSGEFIYQVTRFYVDFYQQSIGKRACFLHDPTALTFLVSPELFELREGPVRVVTEGCAEGMTIQKIETKPYSYDDWQQRPNQSVAIAVDSQKVLELFSNTVRHE
ncbi:nucleoside hydrolase [Veronia pacifica]|uniref:Nucleoside hydrolase n=1 Tax=Veronia pacifica TaxID=1080227 RepID=A0A1C3EKU1_9GAMM|nr:nucleoside hydrolase [Veronia pacifica]ODA33853.1 nucleoside hydrolase [Veronia pacifica]